MINPCEAEIKRVNRRLILASGSPRRADLLSKAGFDFEVVLPKVVEGGATDGISADRLVLQNARLKGEWVYHAFAEPGIAVIGADTVIEYEGAIFGKPENESDAQRMLSQLNGHTHRVWTGVWMGFHDGPNSDRVEEWVERADVTFHQRDESFRNAYIRRIGSLDKAGGYAAQTDDGDMISEINGSFSSVVGLPIEHVAQQLNAWGFRRSVLGEDDRERGAVHKGKP